ncbi:hypothetical protein ACOKM5_40370 [Streptomyces sp. BH097]|uniref:hypothetical protein n=1 Tax=unclassified Streptomyces TaxID=2593676 RepID=UPI003BB74189
MTRAVWLVGFAVLVAVAAGLTITMAATSEPEPHPTPSRVYSSCLAADTRPLAEGENPCAGS